RSALHEALAARPSVIHFATHILQAPERASSALIALGLAENGQTEFLSAAEIGGWQLDAGLVVLSGCSSGVARALPGSGLMGITRSWLMAGAGAVLASQWPTPDDSGALFLPFYERLQQSGSTGPADALQCAQRNMIHRQDWRAQPKYWAAYFVLGND
ncbi:MAG: CHAT domain-containing protein, partial [Bryobacteraceae bacterium]